MSAMLELREGLRKRGESWHKWPDEDSTTWQAYSNPHTATESMDGTLIVTGLTPEQAIAATLGPTDPRERGLIPHFWTGDWTLHIEAARLPERIDVTLPDQRGREVYSARVHHFVPERTCHNVHEPPKDTTFWPAPHFKCSECGATHVSMEYVFYCPNCGRKVVDE